MGCGCAGVERAALTMVTIKFAAEPELVPRKSAGTYDGDSALQQALEELDDANRGAVPDNGHAEQAHPRRVRRGNARRVYTADKRRVG